MIFAGKLSFGNTSGSALDPGICVFLHKVHELSISPDFFPESANQQQVLEQHLPGTPGDNSFEGLIKNH